MTDESRGTHWDEVRYRVVRSGIEADIVKRQADLRANTEYFRKIVSYLFLFLAFSSFIFGLINADYDRNWHELIGWSAICLLFLTISQIRFAGESDPDRQLISLQDKLQLLDSEAAKTQDVLELAHSGRPFAIMLRS